MTNNAYPLKPIQTEADYRAALQLVAPYFKNEPQIDSDAGTHFEAMVALIQAYEAKHYPIAGSD
jgi:HTH-type transcriptional regulator / antitoxin HigA